jgi:hypothetical protein
MWVCVDCIKFAEDWSHWRVVLTVAQTVNQHIPLLSSDTNSLYAVRRSLILEHILRLTHNPFQIQFNVVPSYTHWYN